jgi:hypothetical protein
LILNLLKWEKVSEIFSDVIRARITKSEPMIKKILARLR